MISNSSSLARLRTGILFALAAGLIGLATTGCVRLLEPRTSDATYYLLHDAETEAPPDSTDANGLTVGLRRTRLAAYLDPTRLLIRRGPHRVELSEFHRWAEDLDQGIGRTVALALMDRQNIRLAETAPWPQGATFDYIVQLHVLSFEGVGPLPDPDAPADAPAPTGHAQMEVQWTVLDPADDTVLARGVTQHREDGWRVNDYEALVSHLGTGLTTLANELADRLQSLSPVQPPR